MTTVQDPSRYSSSFLASKSTGFFQPIWVHSTPLHFVTQPTSHQHIVSLDIWWSDIRHQRNRKCNDRDHLSSFQAINQRRSVKTVTQYCFNKQLTQLIQLNRTHANQTTKSSSLNLCDKHVTMQHNTTLHNLKQLISLFSHAGVYPRPCNHLHYPNFYYPHLTIFMIFFGHAHQLASVWRQTGGKVIETALGFQRNHKITVASTFLHCWLT